MWYLKQTTDVVCGLSQKSSSVFCNTTERGEKIQKKRAHFWVSILIYLALSKCSSGKKIFCFTPNNTAWQKCKVQLLCRVNTTIVRGCSSQHWQSWALSLHWAMDGRAMALLRSPLLWGSFPQRGAAAVSPQSHREGLPPQPAASVQWLKTLPKGSL